MRRLLSRLLRRQDGIALPVVIGSLTVVTGLAVGTFAVSLESHHASSRDRDSKRALAAAEAGLQMAILKTTSLKPGAAQCVTTAVVSINQTTGECPSTLAISIGNGATYRYVVATPTSGTCATLPGFSATAGKDRCITSIGSVNGIQRRLQMRFYYSPPFLPWANAGLVGKNKVDIGNNKIIDSAIGTNGEIILGNNSNAWEFLIPTGAPNPDVGNNATVDTQVAGGSAVRTPRVPTWEFPEIDWATPRSTHHNHQLVGIPGWDGKYLKLGQHQDITLPGGTYYMCGLDAPNGNDINVPSGQFVKLYIDSALHNPAWCNGGDPADGRFQIKNNGKVNPLPTNDPKAEQFAMFVHGSTNNVGDASEPDVDMNNGAAFWGTIWAPNSTISIKNNQAVSGGFTGGSIDMKNNGGFAYDADVANQALPGTASAKNLSWTECARNPSVSTDPESGCS
jgi:Tfp pilus assembly protein PilX